MSTPDVVDLIMADHREVERLFGELKSKPDQRALLLPTLASLLTAHSRAEEAEVYPAARTEAGETDEVAHSQEEHEEADALLAELVALDPLTAEFESKLDEVVKAVTHHVEEEESSVLPGMRKNLDEARLSELAEAFAQSRAEHLGDQPGQATKDELLQQARNMGVSGSSTMSKEDLEKAVKPS